MTQYVTTNYVKIITSEIQHNPVVVTDIYTLKVYSQLNEKSKASSDAHSKNIRLEEVNMRTHLSQTIRVAA